MLGRAPVRRYAQRAADAARLWVQGHLFGLDPVELEHCRVLELGCGDGAHLAGLAARHPGMQLLGLDERADAIAEGRRLAERAGLTNLRLELCEPGGLTTFDESFDYVVCLGLFARADGDERQQLLATLSRLLTARGLACVEYDVHPAFRLHELVAGVVQRLRARSGAALSAQTLRTELATLLEAGAASRALASLRPELEAWARRDDAWLLAELAAPRHGLLFRDFCGMLGQRELRYVCESSYVEGNLARFRGRAQALLESRQTQLDREQYVDFLSGRRQRRSVLARAAAQPSSTALPERCRSLYCVSPLRARDGRDFVAPGGLTLSIPDELVATVVAAAASAWPEAISYAELATRVHQRLAFTESPAIERALLLAHERDWLELRASGTGCARVASEKPKVSDLNRAELELGRPMTNRLHVPISLGQGPAAQLVSWLDGTRDRAALASLLWQHRAMANEQSCAGAVSQVLDALAGRALLESDKVSS